MYLPTQFREDSVPVLHKAIRAARLANLVTLGPDGLIASPVPMLLDADPAPYGTLFGHISRANPQWRAPSSVDALAIFMGPDAYITPSWYETKRQTGKVVPTWNYVTIHAYGPVTFFDDPEELRRIVTMLTEKHEAGRSAPWAVSDAPEDFVRAQLKGIVGFRMPVTRLEGKWKMSQNRPAEDRARVVAGLREEGGAREAMVADIVAERS